MYTEVYVETQFGRKPQNAFLILCNGLHSVYQHHLDGSANFLVFFYIQLEGGYNLFCLYQHRLDGSSNSLFYRNQPKGSNASLIYRDQPEGSFDSLPRTTLPP